MPALLLSSFRPPPRPARFPPPVPPAAARPVVPVELVLQAAGPVELVLQVARLVVPVELALQVARPAVQVEPVVLVVLVELALRAVVPAEPVHLLPVAHPLRAEHLPVHRSWMLRELRAVPRPESWMPPEHRSPVPRVARRSRMPQLMPARVVCPAPVAVKVPAVSVAEVRKVA